MKPKQPSCQNFCKFFYLFLINTSVFLILSACAFSQQQIRQNETNVLALPTPTPAIDPQDECLTFDEVQIAGRDEIAQRENFCYSMPDGSAYTIQQRKDIDHLRVILLDPELKVWFQMVGFAPNAPVMSYPVATYIDRRGRSYMLDLNNGQIVEMTPGEGDGVVNPGLPRLSEGALQQLAESFILRNTPQFASIRSRLAYSGGSKTDVYFARWEDQEATGWENMPPLAQVGLTVNGVIFSYLNTLFTLETR